MDIARAAKLIRTLELMTKDVVRHSVTACLASFCSYEVSELFFYRCFVLYVCKNGSFLAAPSSSTRRDGAVSSSAAQPGPEGPGSHRFTTQSGGPGMALMTQSRGPGVIRA